MSRKDTVETITNAKMNRRSLGLGAAGVAGAAAITGKLGGLSPQGALAQDDFSNTLKLSLAAATNVDLNPIGVRTLDSFWLNSCIYDPLVVLSPSWDEVEPALAESYEVSEDGLVYTFHLRQGVTWHDGEAFTADDVQFTYTTILTQELGSTWAADLQIIAGATEYFEGTADSISGIEIVDDHTITFTLVRPNSPFITATLTQNTIIPEHVWGGLTPEDLAKPVTWDTGHIGTGPFQFVQYQPDQFIELSRYDEAWRGAPLLDRILFVHVGTTPEAMTAALEAGDIDYLGAIPAAEYDRLEGLGTLNMSADPVYNVRFLSINSAKPGLDNKLVRQAFAHAMDKAGIVEAIIGRGGTNADTITVSQAWANPNVPTYEYDVEKAKALLAEAGWDANQEVVVSLYYTDQAHADSIATVQQMFSEAGINASVLSLDGGAIQAYYYDNAEFDIMLAGYGYAPDFDAFARHFTTDGFYPQGQNAGKFSNARVDELFETGRTSTVMEDRQAAYNEVQEILMDELPWIPFYHLNLVAGMNKRVVDGDSLVNVWNRPYNWNIEKVSIAAE